MGWNSYGQFCFRRVYDGVAGWTSTMTRFALIRKFSVLSTLASGIVGIDGLDGLMIPGT